MDDAAATFACWDVLLPFFCDNTEELFLIEGGDDDLDSSTEDAKLWFEFFSGFVVVVEVLAVLLN